MPADKRRADLAIPYVHTPQARKAATANVLTSTLPIAAMFLKSKVLAWCSLFSAIQSVLNEPTQTTEDSSPAWMGLITAVAAVAITYMDFVFGRPGPKAAPVEGVVDGAVKAAETVVEKVVEAATETLHKLR